MMYKINKLQGCIGQHREFYIFKYIKNVSLYVVHLKLRVLQINYTPMEKKINPLKKKRKIDFCLPFLKT